MAVPMTSAGFGDLLDPRFQKIFVEKFKQQPDMIPEIFDMVGSNGRNELKYSDVGAFGDFSEFTGNVSYDSFSQGYDTTITPLEFASGFQVTRKLYDDNQFPGAFDQRPASLALAAARTRQKDGARIFNNAFSVDATFYNNTEGLALCSDAHTTTASGVDTSTGFDNKGTAALSATAVIAARKQMVKFRDDRGNRITIVPDELYVPVDLWDVGHEIVESMGKPGTADNDKNVLQGSLNVKEWIYLTDTNNWFMGDSALRKEFLKWEDRVPLELAFVEDFDTLIAKWRAYMRYGNGHLDWRFILGAEVS